MLLVLTLTANNGIPPLLPSSSALKGKYVSYVDIVNAVFGRWLGYTLYAAIVITCIGACAAYLVFWYAFRFDVVFLHNSLVF